MLKWQKLLIRGAHVSQYGNVQLGRNFHRSPESTLKHIIVSDIGFFQHKLLFNITTFVRKCMFCNIARPIKVRIPPGTRVAGSMNSDPAYSHISWDNVHLRYFHPVINGRCVIKYYVLIATCLTYGHVTIEKIDSNTSISIGLALRRIEIRYKVRIQSIWTDAYSSLKKDSLSPHTTGKSEVVWENLACGLDSIKFHTNVPYSKTRSFVEHNVKDVKSLLSQCHPVGKGKLTLLGEEWATLTWGW